MGMFDYARIPVTCKNCGKESLEGQTKDTECDLKTYELRDGFLFSKELDTEAESSFEPDYYSGHMDVWLHCCGGSATGARFVFVRGKLEYREPIS